MCGIAGSITTRPDADAGPGLQRALAALLHRGPDECGSLTVGAGAGRGPLVTMGNRRLRILDLTEAGRQPMTTADGRHSITYNGEIYNHVELRRELERAGRSFRSHSDTEVLLEAWAAWGEAAFARLEGMFAAAIVDRERRILVLVRDGFGIKPLFYSARPHRLVFASEIAGLRAFGGVGRQIDAERLRQYLSDPHASHPCRTLLADVQQLAPGHYSEIAFDRPGEMMPICYWSPAVGQRSSKDLPAAAAELRELFTDSVRGHLRSDVPVGFSLSGGLDSSAVLLCARRVLGPNAELPAFGFVADDPAIAEVEHQRSVAAAAGARLHAVHVDAAELERDFDRVVDVQGEPFGSPAICVQYRVFARAREEGVKVVLGGQGADELFAGYRDFLPARATSLARSGRLLASLAFLRQARLRTGKPSSALLRRMLAYALPEVVTRGARRLRGRRPTGGWIREGWFAERGVPVPLPWRPRGGEALKDQLLHVIRATHLQALMRYEDRNAAALSMENRVPFLTPRLARFALSLPESHLVSPTAEQKAVLRAAMRGIVPDAIIDRRDRIGFGVPVVRWLGQLGPWVEGRLPQVLACPAIEPDALRRHWSAVRTRDALGSAYVVWRCLTLSAWAERGGIDWQ